MTVVARPDGQFQAQVRVGKTKLYKTFPTREEAQAYEDTMVGKIKAAKLGAKPAPGQAAKARIYTLTDLLNERIVDIVKMFESSGEIIPRHKKNFPTILKFVRATELGGGEARLADVDKQWVKDYIKLARDSKTRVGRQFSYETIWNHLRILHRIFRWRAESMKMECPNMPFSAKLLPAGWENKRWRRLSPKEEARLRARLAELGDSDSAKQWRLLIDLALQTGARLQELVFATWANVSFDECRWTIPAEDTKCKQTRHVPMSPECERTFRELEKLRAPASGRVFHALGTPGTVSALFRRYREQAGIEDFRFHDLRHEAISRMVRAKLLPESSIKDIVGHHDDKMFARYANLTVWEQAEMLAGRSGIPAPEPIVAPHGPKLVWSRENTISGGKQ